jgi:hypothetical protein
MDFKEADQVWEPVPRAVVDNKLNHLILCNLDGEGVPEAGCYLHWSQACARQEEQQGSSAVLLY